MTTTDIASRTTAAVASPRSGVAGMVVVGSSVGVSRTLTDAPLFTAQAIRYAAATVILLLLARALGVRVHRPHGREWCWLVGVAVTGLVVFNVAVVRGVAHAEPAVIAVAVACAPVLISVIGPLLEGRKPARAADGGGGRGDGGRRAGGRHRARRRDRSDAGR